ncbi:MAG: ABC transporter permease [Acetatifactor sp.]|nr:ABC transporter permease [Acetatifactor sp.]
MLFLQFVKRNILLYFRDRASVFFSLLATLIVVALMIAFLGEGAIDSTLYTLGVGQVDERSHAMSLVIIWTISGIVVVNAVSVSMMLVGRMVTDVEGGRFSAFMVAPVRRFVYVIGYVTASVLVAFMMCLLTLLIGEGYVTFSVGVDLEWKMLGEIVCVLLAILFSSASFVFLCAVSVRTASAYAGLNTVVSSLIGFLAGIYVPFGALPKLLQQCIRFVPAFQGASAFRQILMEREIEWFGCAAEYKEGYADYMGLVIKYGGEEASLWAKVAYMISAGVFFIVIATMILQKKKEE